MNIKTFSKRDWTILLILLAILGVAALFFGSRGIFFGIILLYINASIDIIRQIKNWIKTGRIKNAISNLVAFTIITILLFTVFIRLLW
jgi:hypothetical protein